MTTRPTIVDVARRAGVSKSLVSLVMRNSPSVSEEKRQRVLRAASELAYRPNAMARSLVRQRTYVIGVVISDFNNPFFNEIAGGIEEAALAADYRALFNSGDRDPIREQTALDTLLQLRTDGVVLTGPALNEAAVRKAARETPVVMATRGSRSRLFDSVVSDDIAGARLAIEHLIALGHRRIFHLSGGEGAGARQRRDGYELAMHHHGLHPVVVEGDYTERTALAIADQLLDGRSLPTAIFAPNDFAAIGLLQALDDRGFRVPDDISVVGYDDTWLAGLARIGLTTVHQDPRRMGATAVSLLLERIDGQRTTARHVVVQPELTIRATTGPAPTNRVTD
ncbi:MAG: LacI family DNA-binding transcriptional regulator [Actinomycetota bacterium]